MYITESMPANIMFNFVRKLPTAAQWTLGKAQAACDLVQLKLSKNGWF